MCVAGGAGHDSVHSLLGVWGSGIVKGHSGLKAVFASHQLGALRGLPLPGVGVHRETESPVHEVEGAHPPFHYWGHLVRMGDFRKAALWLQSCFGGLGESHPQTLGWQLTFRHLCSFSEFLSLFLPDWELNNITFNKYQMSHLRCGALRGPGCPSGMQSSPATCSDISASRIREQNPDSKCSEK